MQTDDQQWQQAYAAELKRTGGKSARFEKAGGGWWQMHVDDSPTYQKHRKADVLRMTQNLKQRPDHASGAEPG